MKESITNIIKKHASISPAYPDGVMYHLTEEDVCRAVDEILSLEDEVNIRHFFVTTSGQNTDNSLLLHQFNIIKKDGNFPSLKECIQKTKETHPDQNEVIVIAISEISINDFEQFVSS